MKRKSSLTIGALLLLTLTTLPLQGNAEGKESEHLHSSEGKGPPIFAPQDCIYKIGKFSNARQESWVWSILAAPG